MARRRKLPGFKSEKCSLINNGSSHRFSQPTKNSKVAFLGGPKLPAAIAHSPFQILRNGFLSTGHIFSSFLLLLDAKKRLSIYEMVSAISVQEVWALLKKLPKGDSDIVGANA